MSGESEYSTLAKRRIEKRDGKIEEYENNLGLPSLPDRKNECRYLKLNGEEISRFTPEQCGEAAAELAVYGVYIQRKLSRERGILRWLESRIDLAIASELNSYEGYYSHSQRRSVAIVGNNYARELEEFRINSQLKVDILDGLTYQINQLCRVLLESQNAKRQQRQ